MASPNLSEIATTTMLNRSRRIADNVTENNAVLTRLSTKGRIKPFSGGREIIQELSYQENGTFKYYSGYESLDISPSDVLSAATYAIKQAAVAVTISGLEQIQNSGKEQMIDLLDARMDVSEATMKNQLSAGIYSDGTGSGGKQITGLLAQVSKTPSTGTVGGINRANHSFWRNQDEDPATKPATNADLLTAMRNLWLSTCRGSDKADLILADNNTYSLFWSGIQDRQRFTRDGGDMAKAGFSALAFNSADVVADGAYGGNAPTDTMYFLNTDHIMWRPYRGRNMVPLDQDRYSVNQDAMVKLLVFAGNLTMSNAFLQGVLDAS